MSDPTSEEKITALSDALDYLHGLTPERFDALRAAEARAERYRKALESIRDAKLSQWEPDVRDQFQEWSQNIARAALRGEG